MSGPSEDNDISPDNQKDDHLAFELASFRQQWYDELVDKNESSGQEEKLEDIQDKAIKCFHQGVLYEQEKRMHEAVQCYKKAIQLVPDVEMKFNKLQTELNEKRSRPTNPERKLPEEQDAEPENVMLSDLISGLQNINFESPCEKERPTNNVHVSVLPSELLLYVFQWVISDQLDLLSFNNLSQVCKWFYLCSRDNDIWKRICERIWGKSYSLNPSFDWRSFYASNQHPYFDGVYISSMSYHRPGEQGLDNFYRPYHTVEHYRYLRFFPNGTVLVCSSPYSPEYIVPLMRLRDYHHHDISLGDYTLSPGKVKIILKKVIASGKEVPRRKRGERSLKHVDEQTFHMEFDIVSSGKKRKSHQIVWKKYVCNIHYRSTGTSHATEFDLSDFKPLVFSRVKSYLQISNAPV